jgi:hypothetical protein
MKNILLILVFSSFLLSCEKQNEEPALATFKSGTYQGEKAIQNFSTNNYSIYTVTITFDSTNYLYSGSWELDYGKGKYFISNDSIEFNDELFRNTMHSWNWILSGKYKFKFIDDSLIFTRKQYDQLTTLRLIKIAGQ